MLQREWEMLGDRARQVMDCAVPHFDVALSMLVYRRTVADRISALRRREEAAERHASRCWMRAQGRSTRPRQNRGRPMQAGLQQLGGDPAEGSAHLASVVDVSSLDYAAPGSRPGRRIVGERHPSA